MSAAKSLKTDKYVPHPGDIVWTDFDPRVGREQSGRRPAVVVSIPALYDVSDFVIVCPITKRIRRFGSSVILDEDLPIQGEILTYQVRSIDTLARPMVYAGASLSTTQLAELREKLAMLMEIQ